MTALADEPARRPVVPPLTEQQVAQVAALLRPHLPAIAKARAERDASTTRSSA